MPVNVPPEAYQAYARGEISHEDLVSLEKTAEALNKRAGIDSRNLAAIGGLAVAAPTLAYLGSQVPEKIESTLGAMTFTRDLRRVVEVNPQLGSPDDPNLRMAFKTLRSTNPEYSKDPLIAGTILDMVMTNRMDPDDPSSAPRFDPALLTSIQNKTRTSGSYAAEQGARAIVDPVSKTIMSPD